MATYPSFIQLILVTNPRPYQPGNQVTYEQNYYIALVENINEVPTNPTYWQQISSSETYLGTYSGATAYVPGNEVSYQGNYYICISATTGNAPSTTSSFWTLLGTSAILIGAWSNSTAYIPGNEVTFNQNYYVCTTANTNAQPDTHPSDWTQITTSTVFLGAWSSVTAYVQGNQVVYNGSYWVCTTANTNQLPSTASSYWTLVGTSSVLLGSWSSSTAYVAGNEVTYQPSGGAVNYYVALQASTNVAPTNTSYWYLLSNNTAINAGASYRPESNPLTATDAGSSATITIASFTMNVAGIGNVSVNGGSITGLAYSTLYYVYYADPTISGGSVTFLESTTKTDAITSGIDFFVGSIVTPFAGGPQTVGNNDGGTGAQYGFYGNLFAGSALTSQPADWTNFSNINDGNVNTYATGATSGLASTTATLSGFSGIAPSYTSLVLNVKTSCLLGGSGQGTITVSYSINGGTSFTNIYSFTGSFRAITTDTVTLASTQNIGAIQVKVTVASNGGSDTASVNFYEAWVEAAG